MRRKTLPVSRDAAVVVALAVVFTLFTSCCGAGEQDLVVANPSRFRNALIVCAQKQRDLLQKQGESSYSYHSYHACLEAHYSNNGVRKTKNQLVRFIVLTEAYGIVMA